MLAQNYILDIALNRSCDEGIAHTKAGTWFTKETWSSNNIINPEVPHAKSLPFNLIVKISERGKQIALAT